VICDEGDKAEVIRFLRCASVSPRSVGAKAVIDLEEKSSRRIDVGYQFYLRDKRHEADTNVPCEQLF
jgi:hypothetical protein